MPLVMNTFQPAHEFDFAKFEDSFDKKGSVTRGKIHIRIHQRNGKKCITTVEGLDDDLDIKRICRALRTLLNCNGNVVDSKEGDVMQLQGDQRDLCRRWLLEECIVSRSDVDRIVVHGF